MQRSEKIERLGRGEELSEPQLMAPEGMQAPVVYGRLAARRGYQPDFLELDDDRHVPLPTLTARGKRAAAKLEDDSMALKYHKFSSSCTRSAAWPCSRRATSTFVPLCEP